MDINKQPVQQKTTTRLVSMDAYRGLVMFLMMAEVLDFNAASKTKQYNAILKSLAWQQYHVDWVGCTAHDFIQPSFTFLVGVALPFSIASRLTQGGSTVLLFAHAFLRSIILILLGIFLRSYDRTQTYFTFEDTLTQIGLGYFFLFCIGFLTLKRNEQTPQNSLLRQSAIPIVSLIVILVGYWAYFALHPVPATDFDLKSVGVPADWPHNLSGFAAHWNKNTNAAAKFDEWFLNLFPTEQPFSFNQGGYLTLSFIPTLGTMLLGLIAGIILKPSTATNQTNQNSKIIKLTVIGGLLVLAGWGLGQMGICPIVKRIWTPSWTIFSGGFCFLILAFFFSLVDNLHWKWLVYPLVVIGANSITAYFIAETFFGSIKNNLKTHFGKTTFSYFGNEYQTIFIGSCVLLIAWLILWWMYRKKLFIRI